MASKAAKKGDGESTGGDDRVSEARQRFQRVAESVHGRYDDLSSEVRRGAERATQEIRRSAERASTSARQRYSDASEGLRQGYDRMRQDLGSAGSHLNEYLQRHPGRAMVSAALVGFVLGLLLRGGRDR